MKARGKLFGLFTALLCLLPLMIGMFGSTQQVSAAGTTVDVTLNKKKMDVFPTEAEQNTGEEMNDIFGKYQGLKDVTFKVWDITKDFYIAMGNTDNLSEVQYAEKVKQVKAAFKLANASNKADIKTDKTDDDGNVTFSDLAKRDADGRYKVYYFEETMPQGAEADMAGPLILVLPAINASTKDEIEDIHLYQKNKMEDGDSKKEVLDDEGEPRDPSEEIYDYDIGKKIKYRVTYRIPTQIGEIIKNGNATQTRYSQLVFNDRLNKTGIKFEGITKIAMNGQDIDNDAFLKTHSKYQTYGVTSPYSDAAGFEIKMNFNTGKSTDSNKTNYDASVAAANYMKQYAGQEMVIEYEVSLTEFTAVDEEINNTFTVKLKHDNGKEETVNHPELPGVTTGGQKVFKYEDGHENQGLGKAQFVVIKEIDNKDYFLTKAIDDKDGKVVWQAVKASNEDWKDAKVYTSGDDGKFSVKGLEYGSYKLREIKAPDGFQLLPADHPFEISQGSFAESAIEKIANTSRGGFLPSTGGIGIVIFLVIGGSLMAFAYSRYRKTQHTA